MLKTQVKNAECPMGQQVFIKDPHQKVYAFGRLLQPMLLPIEIQTKSDDILKNDIEFIGVQTVVVANQKHEHENGDLMMDMERSSHKAKQSKLTKRLPCRSIIEKNPPQKLLTI